MGKCHQWGRTRTYHHHNSPVPHSRSHSHCHSNLLGSSLTIIPFNSPFSLYVPVNKQTLLNYLVGFRKTLFFVFINESAVFKAVCKSIHWHFLRYWYQLHKIDWYYYLKNVKEWTQTALKIIHSFCITNWNLFLFF